MIGNELDRASAEIPSEIGPFRISGVLGRGGMGVVYRGEHCETGALAAVKTITATTPSVVSAIRREIRSLGRLRHPGIARIIDSGISRGLPWYAMNLLVGGTLRDHLVSIRPEASGIGGLRSVTVGLHTQVIETQLRQAEPKPHSSSRRSLGRESLLAIIASVCDALAYLHESGIVHRDLKPENIFIQADGAPVLVDLGISAEFAGARGREELDGARFSRMGTIAYMSPEQIRGELVDARADLYAVGCVLYECVTGRRVFEGADAFSLKTAHLSEVPVAPSQLAPDVSKELDELILQLLEKDPAARRGYADDVARTLATLSVAPRAAAQARPPTYLYRPPFVGREQVLHRFKTAIVALNRDGVGEALFLGGESGVGKTRLATEAVLEAERVGVNVVVGHCLSFAVGPDARSNETPLHAFAPLFLAIADRCQQHISWNAEQLLGAHGRLLAPYQPALAHVPGFAELPEPEPGEGQEARARVLSAAVRAILNFTEMEPLLLVIDDLQWADELSLALVDLLAKQELATTGLLLIATYRSDEGSPVLRRLVTGPGGSLIEVKRFNTFEVRAMVQGMLALRHAEASLVDYLVSQSNGNPFFLVEHLRTAIAAELLTRDGRGRWQLTSGGSFEEAMTLPTTLAELIRRRLHRLQPEALRLVKTAAILGRQFDVELLQTCADLDAVILSQACALLCEHQILEGEENGRLRFVHDGLRQAAYLQIDAAELEPMHGRAAVAIEQNYSDQAREPYYAELGHHFSQSRARARAAYYFELAGELARGTFANAAAIRHFKQALLESTDLHTAEIARARAHMQERLGELLLIEGDAAEACASMEAAIEATASTDVMLLARRRRKLGRVLERQHRHSDAIELYGRAEQALGASPAADSEAYWHELVQIQVDAAPALYFMHKVDDLDALVARAQPIVERHGDAAQRSRFFTSMAQSMVRRERFKVDERALSFTDRALCIGQQSTDPRERAAAEFAHAFPLTLYGDYAAAEPLFVRAVDGAERVGDTALLTRVLAYFGVLMRRTERVSETRALAERTLELAQKMQMYDYIGVACSGLAWASTRTDDFGGAADHASKALEAWSKLPAAYVFPLQWLARIPYAACLSRKGKDDRALDELAFISRTDQMALPDELATLIARAQSSFREHASVGLDDVWATCRSNKYL
ncbi:MAG: protein kinase [Pseudomonadota bacterium]